MACPRQAVQYGRTVWLARSWGWPKGRLRSSPLSTPMAASRCRRSPDKLRSVFDVGFAAVTVAVPFSRLAITSPDSYVRQIVVASWTCGVAAFTVDGAPLWHRRDIRCIHRLCTLPTGAGTGQTRVGVVQERGPGLVLGATGGTRYRLPAARFLAGGADGSVLVHTRSGVHLRPGPDQDPVWRIELGTFAILDAVLNDETLICGADGRLRLVDGGGLGRGLRWNYGSADRACALESGRPGMACPLGPERRLRWTVPGDDSEPRRRPRRDQ